MYVYILVHGIPPLSPPHTHLFVVSLIKMVTVVDVRFVE